LPRFLVAHDYGMGSLYWWIEAKSAQEIAMTYAEVQVIDPSSVDVASFDTISSLRLGDTPPAGLADLAAQRAQQRTQPGFGALLGRGMVYLRREWPEEGEVYFLEYDEQGYRTRQVVVIDDGHATRSSPDDWFLNPPEDLWNPELAGAEIAREEFEALWSKAVPMDA